MLSTLDSRRVPDHTYHVVHIGNLSLVPTMSKYAPTLKEVLATKDRLAQPSSRVTSFFLPHDNLRVGERGFGQVVTRLHQLTMPIYQHVVGTFNACSRGLTHQSLTNTSGGYNLECASFPHYTLRHFQPAVSTFHLRAPPGLRLSKLNITL
jgi:hypothetical protein